MNFHDKNEIPPKYIYLFLAVICFILLFFSILFEDRVSPLKAITSTVITPMQSGVNEVGSSIYEQVVEHKDKQKLIEENKQLTAKLEDYSSQIKIYEQESYELKRLQELLQLKEQYVEYNTIGARVIATDSTNWFHTFVIDKGSDDGVQVGCNILAGHGLAGIVTEVGSNYAKVRAIIDDSSNVSAAISGTQALCTVSGDLATMKNGYIKVGYINKAEDIEEGSELVTSHVSDKFLPGLLIGYISEIEMDANNLTKSAKCIPVVDFQNLQEVLVILDLRSDIKTDSESKNLYDSITKNRAAGTTSKEKGGNTEPNEQTTQSAVSEESNSEDTSSEENNTSEEAVSNNNPEEDPVSDNNENSNNPDNGE